MASGKSGLDFTALSGKPYGFRDVAAAGTVITDATDLASYSGMAYNVTGANSAKGVQLPVAYAGKFAIVRNASTSATLLVYGQSGASINGGTASAAYTIAPGFTTEFMAVSSTGWVTTSSSIGGSTSQGGLAVALATAPAVTGVSVVDTPGFAGLHVTVITLTAVAVALSDAHVGGGTQILDFPEGVINIMGAYGTVAETTTSTLATTLNAGVTYNWGVGTVVTATQDSGTLATTQQDILPTTNGVASATINVAGANSTGARVAAGAYFDGTGTAKDAFFNVGIAGATDIDGDATSTFTGTVTIIWQYLGDK